MQNATSHHPLRARPALQLVATVLAAAVVAACGGGGGEVGTNGSSGVTLVSSASKSVATGTVSGFGSIIVNGVRYETSGSNLVRDDDGVSVSCGGDDNCGLKLGMEVEIEAGQITRRSDDSSATPSSTATRINFGSSILGLVDSIGTDQWVVLGQTINLTSTTIVSGTAATNSVVEVHGLLDKVTGVITATRIEVKSSSVPAYRLRGQVTDIDTAAGTALLGGQLVSFAGLTNGLTGLVNGQYIRVKLATTKNGAGAWVAQSIKSNERKLGSDDNGSHSELEGLIESLITTAGVTTGFVVNGSTVTLPSGFSNYEHGGAAGLVVGARVEVEGNVVDGALVPSKIEFKSAKKRSERGSDDSSSSSSSANEFEFHGAITNLTATTFVLRGVTFDFSNAAAVSFPKGGSLADLAAWASSSIRVEAKGYLMADGPTVKLVRIKRDND